ncbi:MAG: HEAT repeat domain-containing protein [Planctomycetaceae bacterium]|nr:HEAT repeat domain-containing protein [Planctomycetaceae bacterium]
MKRLVFAAVFVVPAVALLLQAAGSQFPIRIAAFRTAEAAEQPAAGGNQAASGTGQAAAAPQSARPLTGGKLFQPGNHVVILGNTFAERMQFAGYFETLLHNRFPEHQLVVRNIGWSADELTLQPRPLDFGTMDEHLARLEADVVIACFGSNESFAGPGGLDQFRSNLGSFLDGLQSQKYNGKVAPRIVLVSPIAQEPLPADLTEAEQPDLNARNDRDLAQYTGAMREVAGEHGVVFVDLFSASRQLQSTADEPLTFNGIHLTDDGYRAIAPYLAEPLFGRTPDSFDSPRLVQLRAEVNEKSLQFWYRHRAVNGYYIYGGRKDPFGTVSFPSEMEKLDQMIAVRDRRVWDVAAGKDVPEEIDDSGTLQIPQIESNYTQDITILEPEAARQAFTMAKGYEVNLFASEKDFPELENPVSMTFDARGRLWVCTMPSYPQYLPGTPVNDKLLILEDTDHDGKADTCTTFADGLHIPAGFELGDGGVYLAQQPDIVFLKDTDGDNRADFRRTILNGFGTEDSHHAISAFEWSPGGALHFQEGTFHHSQIETPWGPERLVNAGVFRFEPRTWRTEAFVSYQFANPWGHIYDSWGQNFVADASGGSNYFGTAFSGYLDYPEKHPRMKEFTTTKVRPTAGCEFVSSRHFPDEAQGNFLLNNCIGFQGIKQHQVIEEGSGFTTKEIEPLLQSSDPNFRPVDIQFGADGALYIVDWFNPLVGHMQHSLRDPKRDHSHGRVWRITYPSRPLVEQPKIAGQSITAQLDLLKSYEDRTRYRARLALREHPTNDVMAALEDWVEDLDPNDEDYEHHLLEGLWVTQHHHRLNRPLLEYLLRAKEPRARAAATRVVCYQRHMIPDAVELLALQADDDFPRVRLEAVRALSFFRNARAAEAALEVLKHPTDYYLDYTLTETMRQLEQFWKPAVTSGQPFATGNPAGVEYILGSIATPELLEMQRSEPVLVALLARPGVTQQHRTEALTGLARLRNTSPLKELLAAIRYVDNAASADTSTMYDLAHLLTQQPATELQPVQEELTTLARAGRRPITRQIGHVALLAAGQTAETAWQQASRSTRSLRDLLDAIPLVPGEQQRAAFAPFVTPLIDGLPESLRAGLDSTQGVSGRYVRIELPGKNRTLCLSEVEVYSGGENVARRGKARQSSTDFGGVAARGIDGGTQGEFGRNTLTHSRGNETDPWWEVDLGAEYPIDAIAVYNRSELKGKYADRLEGFRLVVLDAGRQQVYEKNGNPAPPRSVRFQLQGDPAGVIRRSAINASTSLPGSEVEVFHALAALVKRGDERHAAVRALHRIPRRLWPQDEIRPLVNSLVEYAREVPPTDRTLPSVLDSLQLGNDLASLLPRQEASRIRKEIGDLGVQTILIRPVPHRLMYDRKVIAVQAGEPVQIVLENIDIMPHNLIVCSPGTLAEIGMAAEKMATQPDAFAKQFIPEHAGVLHATQLLQSRETERLNFVAPTEPGEYGYVCTFPGHWRRMYGTMHVVRDLEAWLAENPIPETTPQVNVREFVKDWQLADLTAALPEIETGRSFEQGKQMFAAAACIQCHRMNEMGGIVGPDLAKWDARMTPLDLLTEILDPSKKVKKDFQAWVVVTEEGRQYIGRILSETEQSIQLMPNPVGLEECEPITIVKDEIEFREPSKLSLMPTGLLKTLKREEILDLLAYIRARGQAGHSAFAGK